MNGIDHVLDTNVVIGYLLPDAVIAATAIELGATLVTCDSNLTDLEAPGLRVLNPQATSPPGEP